MSGSQYISLYNETNGEFNNLIVDGDVDLSNANITVNSIKFADGTAAAPSITFVEDLDTDIFRKGDNSVSISAQGTERLNIDETGANVFGFLDVTDDITNSGFILNPGGLISGFGVNFTVPVEIDSNVTVLNGNINVNDGEVYALTKFKTDIGDPSLPNFTFVSDDDTGMYSNASDTLSFSAGGQEKFRVSPGKLTSYEPIHNVDGSASAPAYSFESAINLGIYKGGTNTLSVGSNGAEVFNFKNDRITSYKNFYNVDGSASAPFYSFDSATNLGFYKNSANTVSVTSNGSEVMRFNNSLNQMYVPLAWNAID